MATQDTIHQEAKLKALDARKDHLDAKVQSTQKALSDKKSQSERPLPPSDKPVPAPLIQTILAIPDAQEMRYLEQDAEWYRIERDYVNDYIDHWYPILRVELEEEVRLRRTKNEWVWRKYWEGERRREKARTKAAERQRDDIGMAEFLSFRAALKEEAMEEGQFDVIGTETETVRDWWDRVHDLSTPILRGWQQYEAKILAEQPRYLEGFPVRDSIQMPRVWTGDSLANNMPACWQCKVKGMVCSLQVTRFDQFGIVAREGEACTRCVRNGDRGVCCMKSDRLSIGWRKTEMTHGQKQALKKDKILREKVGRKTGDMMMRWAERYCSWPGGVGVDFFATHVTPFNPRTRRVERRMSIGFNTHWWDRKKSEEMSRAYWKRREELAKPGVREKMEREEEEERARRQERIERLEKQVAEANEERERIKRVEEQLYWEERHRRMCKEEKSKAVLGKEQRPKISEERLKELQEKLITIAEEDEEYFSC